ncbi:MAG: HAMP domain-containing sensor histidine kinase [Pseudomonadota bacterium]
MHRQFAGAGRDSKDVANRVDVGIRMGLLGFSAAAATVFNALAVESSPTSLLIGAVLASTSLFGLHWLKRASNSQIPYLVAGGVWIAGLSYLISTSPISASLALAASLVLMGRAKIFQSSIITSDAEQQAVAARSIDGSLDEPKLLLDRTGAVSTIAVSTIAALGNLEPKLGDKLVDRVHVADRVQYLRAISQLRAGDVETLSLQLRFNTADNTEAARFEDLQIEMTAHNDAVQIKQSTSSLEEIGITQSEEETGSDKRFLTIVSHELRTPLNAIIGFSDVLRSDLNCELPETTRKEYVDLIHGAGNHLLSLVNTILDVSKIESGTYSIDRDEFDFLQTARECIAMLGPQAKQKNILINDRITCSSRNVNGDRRALKQVMINLLSNAVKYTEPKGFVTVDADIDDAGLTFEVSDTGIGICPGDLEMIAKPFAQVDNSITRSNEGTGLGLALVKGLVELHGGSLDISSKLAVGTKVKVHIPNEPEQSQTDILSELKSVADKATQSPSRVSDNQISMRTEIGHGTRKAG